MVEYETVSVAQLFQEELDALREQYDHLIEHGSDQALTAAQNLEHVIRYFESRLGQTTEMFVGMEPDETLH